VNLGPGSSASWLQPCIALLYLRHTIRISEHAHELSLFTYFFMEHCTEQQTYNAYIILHKKLKKDWCTGFWVLQVMGRLSDGSYGSWSVWWWSSV